MPLTPIRNMAEIPKRSSRISPSRRVWIWQPLAVPLYTVCLLLAVPVLAAVDDADQPVVETLELDKTRLDLQFAPGFSTAARIEARDWVKRSAQAVAGYFGRFPVARVTILIIPVEGAGVGSGATFNTPELYIRVKVGRDTPRAKFLNDWILVHEMVHLAMPEVPRHQNWFHEGVATYVETVARAQAGLTTGNSAWSEFAKRMQQGQPQAGDHGLDHTHTWGRTYWGGALFCLLADVEIRKRSNNALGLQDALRGVVAAGGNYAQSWPLEKTLKAADHAVGLTVLEELHARMKDNSVSTDLAALWRDLGVVQKNGDGAISLSDDAPLASIRRAVMTRPAS